MTSYPNYQSDGSPQKHQRLTRALKRVGGGIGCLVFGACSAISGYVAFFDNKFSETQVTVTNTTTTINGVPHTVISTSTYNPGSIFPYVAGAGMIFMAILFLGCLFVVIWPDEA